MQEVLPLLLRERPDVRLRIVGRDPAPEVLALAGPSVEVTGTVEDVRPHLWEAGAYLCPMRSGSGVKNKLLEALAAGAPCVVTPLATAGLELVDGAHALVREHASELAEALLGVLSDPPRADGLAAAGAARAQELSWARTAEGFQAVYRDAVRRRQERVGAL